MGNDWAEDHHDVEIVDETGRRLVKARLPEGLISRLHALLAEHARRSGRTDNRKMSPARWWMESKQTTVGESPRCALGAIRCLRSTA